MEKVSYSSVFAHQPNRMKADLIKFDKNSDSSMSRGYKDLHGVDNQNRNIQSTI